MVLTSTQRQQYSINEYCWGCVEVFFSAVAGRLTVVRRLSSWSSIAISVLLQHWDKQAPMFAATGETEASSPAGDGRNAARGGGAHAPSTARVPGARRSLSVRRDQIGGLIRASLNGAWSPPRGSWPRMYLAASFCPCLRACGRRTQWASKLALMPGINTHTLWSAGRDRASGRRKDRVQRVQS